jgi:Fur family ferric uptake transcriptional regulator
MSHQNIDLADLLHQKGYRMTAQRQMVLDAVCEADGHATPEEIWARVQEKSPAVNRATIYRTLKFLRDMDLVTATILEDGHFEYEIAGEQPHHHFVCRECEANMEFSDEVFAAFVNSLQQRYGFVVEMSHITLTGLCPDCQGQTSQG